ncbi:hypothetical protein ABFA07_011509 [Porites harrisoni]
MAAKFYICMLLVVLVSSAVHSARLRRPQDGEKTSNFLYEKRGARSLPICCYGNCNNCPAKDRYACLYPNACFYAGGSNCPTGYVCCCSN